MSDILLNTVSGDIDIENGQLSLVSGSDEISQLLQQRLRTFREEWFLDLTVGVPYYQGILVKRPNPNLVRSLILNEIINTPGVLEVLEYEDDIDTSTRKLSVDFRARVEDDIINFSEVLP